MSNGKSLTPRDRCFFHTRDRVAQRYGEEINYGDYLRMCKSILEGKSKHVMDFDKPRQAWDVDGLLCVWDENIKLIITVLLENTTTERFMKRHRVAMD